jgi:hypothetical protein
MEFFIATQAHIDTIFDILNIVSMCAVSPVVHTSNISSCPKLSQFSFGFIVINVCNHGEHYETPCIYM